MAPGSPYCVAPRTRNSSPSTVLPQPAPPQISVGRPRGSPPEVSSSSPAMPVGALAIGRGVLRELVAAMRFRSEVEVEMGTRRLDACTGYAGAEPGAGDEITAISGMFHTRVVCNPPNEPPAAASFTVMLRRPGVRGPPEIPGGHADGLVQIGVMPRRAGILHVEDASSGCASHRAQDRSAPHPGRPGEHADGRADERSHRRAREHEGGRGGALERVNSRGALVDSALPRR